MDTSQRNGNICAILIALMLLIYIPQGLMHLRTYQAVALIGLSLWLLAHATYNLWCAWHGRQR